jgi:hypothetical protein
MLEMWSCHVYLRILDHTAARNWQAGKLMGQVMRHIHDHVDCGNPYLYQVIGLLADMRGDHKRKLTALERLKDFGAQFEGEAEFSSQNYAEANVCPLASFGMLKTGHVQPTSRSGGG